MTYLCRICDCVFDEYDAYDEGYLKCPECKSEDVEKYTEVSPAVEAQIEGKYA